MQGYCNFEDLCNQQGIVLQKNISLKNYCTFKIGGSADYLAEPSSEEQLSAVIAFLQQRNIPWTVVGRGSNLLFSDRGYQGIIIHLGANFSGIVRTSETSIECLSGTSLTELCKFAQTNGLAGLEFAYGIPGTVGGAVYMNAGAYGGEMKDVLTCTWHLDNSGVPGEFTIDNLQMGYRQSIYNQNAFIITKAKFELTSGDPAEIQQRMNEYIGRRREKQPLEYPSAGSVFRRPVGNYASALVDQCGLKGKQVGGAQVSLKHAGFIVNVDDATCKDVLELIQLVQDCVKEKTGYELECEIKTIGL